MNTPHDDPSKDFQQSNGCGSGCGCHENTPPEQATTAGPSNHEEDYKDKYLRLLAENENLRRRLQRESQEAIRFATQKVILDLLDPYDNFEKALFHAGYSPSEEVRNWAIGFKMINQQFKDWLNSQGVYSYPSKGEVFNPELHEAVEMIPTHDRREGTIIDEFSKGYKMHDRVLRHAKVAIATKVENNDELALEAEKELSDDELQALHKKTSSNQS